MPPLKNQLPPFTADLPEGEPSPADAYQAAPTEAPQPEASTLAAAALADEMTTCETTIQPHWLSTHDAASSNYQAVWAYPVSPTTPWKAPNGRDKSRHLLLDPRHKDTAGVAGADEWVFIIDLLYDIPRLWDPNQHGKWGREINWHNCAGDAGSSENNNGGVGWSFGSGVSALAFDFLNRDPDVPSLGVLAAYSAGEWTNLKLPAFPSGRRVTYTVHWIAGRTDGSTVRPGYVCVWVDGGKYREFKNINTVQRARGQDGKDYTQRWMSVYEGDYTSALQRFATHKASLTRMGHGQGFDAAFQMALDDRPTVLSTSESAQYYPSGAPQPAPPKPKIVVTAEWKASQSKVPGSTVPPPTQATITSTLNDGDTADRGETWRVTASKPVEKLELWADGAKLAEASNTTVCSHVLDIPPGEHDLGIAVTENGQRRSLGLGGVYATIQVVEPTPPDTLPLHLVSQNSDTITLGWTPVLTGRGYTFWTNGLIVSRTNDPKLAQTRFARRVGDINQVRALVDGPAGHYMQT